MKWDTLLLISWDITWNNSFTDNNRDSLNTRKLTHDLSCHRMPMKKWSLANYPQFQAAAIDSCCLPYTYMYVYNYMHALYASYFVCICILYIYCITQCQRICMCAFMYVGARVSVKCTFSNVCTCACTGVDTHRSGFKFYGYEFAHELICLCDT